MIDAPFLLIYKPSMIITRTVFDLAYMGGCIWALANVPPIDMSLQPVYLFLLCTLISVVAGWASLYRSAITDEEITKRQIISYCLNMGTCGASLSMVLYAGFQPRENLEWYIIGAVGLFSLGGMSAIEVAADIGSNIIKKFTAKSHD